MVATIALAAVLTPQWEPLFNGRDLEGWTKKGGEAVYRVENGMIVGETRPDTPNTFLCTERTFADFELELDVKVHPELNSGVQFRSSSVLGYQNGRVHGYQYEIDPSTRAWTGGIYDEGRRGAYVQNLENNPAARNAFKQNEWNKVRILAVGDRLQTWINGVPAADVRDDLTTSGFIGLQVHGVGPRKDPLTVQFKNIRIRDLGNPVATPPPGAKQILGAPGNLALWQRAGSNGEPSNWLYDGQIATVNGGSMQTREPHEDCELYVEFMVDDNGQQGQGNGNSGVYLQGRYEIQVLNSAGQAPAHDLCGGIYSVKAPDYAMAYPAGVWQNYYIRFRAPRWQNGQKVSNARLTVWHNGTLIHRYVEVPNSTTAGQPEAPNPTGLYLQDHGNKVKYRNIWIRKY